MSAAKLTFPTIEQGATYSHTLQWLQPDGITPVDLTNCSAKMQVRSTVDSRTVIIELSTTNNRITINASLGKFQFTISDEDTTLLAAIKEAVYDLEVYFPNSTVTRLCEGKISISPEVTRNE